MTIPVLLTALGDRFEVLVGTPDVRGQGASRSDAIDSLKAELDHRIQPGELVWVDFEPPEQDDVAGSFADDEICAEIYRQRNAEQLP